MQKSLSLIISLTQWLASALKGGESWFLVIDEGILAQEDFANSVAAYINYPYLTLGLFSTTSSIKPILTASSGDKKVSLSIKASISAIFLPECLT